MEAWRNELYHSQYYIGSNRQKNELYHFGIPKMRWGERRYQNYDGSLTPEGRERYGVGGPRGTSEKKTLSKGQSKAIKIGTALAGPLGGAIGYKIATAKDKKAKTASQEPIVKKPVDQKKSEEKTKGTYSDGFFKTKKGNLNILVNTDVKDPDSLIKSSNEIASVVKNKETLNAIKDQLAKEIMEDKYVDISNTSKDKVKNNLNLYSIYTADKTGDTVDLELNFEHTKNGNDAPYGDHSIDVMASYNIKTKKLTVHKGTMSING